MPESAETGPVGPVGWCARFDLDIPAAVAQQLIEFVGQLRPRPLVDIRDAAALAEIPDEPGIYVLYSTTEERSATRVLYVGKASASLRDRLARHAWVFGGRIGMDRLHPSFVAVPISDNWSAFGPERVLISRLGAVWQNSGFGNKDPGRGRDGTKWKANHFDIMYPVDHAWPISSIPPGEYPVSLIFRAIKEEVPFLFRYADQPEDREALDVSRVQFETQPVGLDLLLARCVDQLPGWHGAVLPGYAVAYPNPHRYYGPSRIYQHGNGAWRIVPAGTLS